MSIQPEPFRMVIEDVFSIKGRGTVVTGRAVSGTLRKGDPILISGNDKPAVSTTVAGFEGFIHDHDHYVAWAGDNCAILVGEITPDQVERGMELTSLP